jgi:hypothetical protein
VALIKREKIKKVYTAMILQIFAQPYNLQITFNKQNALGITFYQRPLFFNQLTIFF